MGAQATDDEHREAVQRVFDAHVDDVWRVLVYLGVPEADLPDVSQEVFLTVHRRLSSFEGRSSMSSWLYGICHRVFAAHRRRAYRRREQPVAEVISDQVSEADQERAVIASERLAKLRAVLETLDEKHRTVFVLYEVERLSMKEIASALSIPLQTGYSRLRAAREHVRSRFEGERRGSE